MLTPQIPVAREGYPFIGLAVFCTLIFAILGFTSVTFIFLVLSLFVLGFFRDPERFIPPDDTALVSPADGKIIIVDRVKDDTFLNDEVFKISIFMNVFNVHVNRAPFTGKVEQVIYKPGKFYSADSEKSALQNEYCATVITTDNNRKIAFVQVAGLIARRIICWFEPGDQAIKGRRFGLIRFGSRVDLYLPTETDIQVEVGQKVRAGETILGKLKP
jgi:phosphatidylserine decarboxylase